ILGDVLPQSDDVQCQILSLLEFAQQDLLPSHWVWLGQGLERGGQVGQPFDCEVGNPGRRQPGRGHDEVFTCRMFTCRCPRLQEEPLVSWCFGVKPKHATHSAWRASSSGGSEAGGERRFSSSEVSPPASFNGSAELWSKGRQTGLPCRPHS